MTPDTDPDALKVRVGARLLASTPGGAAPQAVIAPVADDEGGSTLLPRRSTPPKAYFHVSGVRRNET